MVVQKEIRKEKKETEKKNTTSLCRYILSSHSAHLGATDSPRQAASLATSTGMDTRPGPPHHCRWCRLWLLKRLWQKKKTGFLVLRSLFFSFLFKVEGSLLTVVSRQHNPPCSTPRGFPANWQSLPVSSCRFYLVVILGLKRVGISSAPHRGCSLLDLRRP